MSKTHSFHIPVMGIAFTIDTPLKVSQFGIDSVISLVDDMLLEKLRKMHCANFDIPYEEISEKTKDFRAQRITSYLNLINRLAEKKFDSIRNATSEKAHELKEYFSLLPDSSVLKQEFKKLSSKHFKLEEIQRWIKSNLSMGSIDVNIMTKIDKDNYFKGEKLAVEYNDAHAALRGFAKSDLNSSIVLSAGMNPRLYAYMENFDDFYPNVKGEIKKKIILKVSDYRSALIQGRLFAKKGLWVSEYRIESGLNCGGHAFATEGHLLGPILAEFKENREQLAHLANEVLERGLASKDRIIPSEKMTFLITAQGGVGTAEEHQFLMEHYDVDSVGWGTPFLLVPEVVTIDELSLEKLIEAKEDDLYLSGISPLGVPFNSLKGNTKDIEKMALAESGKPGSLCPKKYVALNNELTTKSICTASRQYQKLKLASINNVDEPEEAKQIKRAAVIEKSCICVGLGTAALLVNNIDNRVEGSGVSVCPGPNLAYFSKKMSLKEMVDHIYGRVNVISRKDRPNMFIKELNIYIDFLRNKIEETKASMTAKEQKGLFSFVENLKNGIQYYENLFAEVKGHFDETKNNLFHELEQSREKLDLLYLKI